MEIAVLAWGSLVWNPQELRVAAPWHEDGPYLPLEFARISSDGRLTLVIYPGAKVVPVLWARSTFDDLNGAIENLHTREGRPGLKRIGRWVSGEVVTVDEGFGESDFYLKAIAEWGKAKQLDAVIWTGLASNFQAKQGRELSKESAREYILSLSQAVRDATLEYIRNAPVQIETEFRPFLRCLTR